MAATWLWFEAMQIVAWKAPQNKRLSGCLPVSQGMKYSSTPKMSKVCQCKEERKEKKLKSLKRGFASSQENVTPFA